MITCEKCGREYSTPPDWPFCPHGGTRNFGAIPDTYPEPVWVENYGPNWIRFDSESQRQAYLKKHHLEQKERWCPLPGTDRDPAGVQNPAGYQDAKTLENGAILMLRAAQGKDFDGVKDGVLRNLTVDVIADAERMKDALGQ